MLSRHNQFMISINYFTVKQEKTVKSAFFWEIKKHRKKAKNQERNKSCYNRK